VRYSFAYSTHQIPDSPECPGGRIACRPVVKVVLIIPGSKPLKKFTCFAILDSGADTCVFPLEFAHQLGLDTAQMYESKSNGMGSTDVPVYSTLMRINLDQGISTEAKVGFTVGLNGQGIGLLGQYGVFDRFVVTFDHRSKLFHIDS
jgi:hypothetical protein